MTATMWGAAKNRTFVVRDEPGHQPRLAALGPSGDLVLFLLASLLGDGPWCPLVNAAAVRFDAAMRRAEALMSGSGCGLKRGNFGHARLLWLPVLTRRSGLARRCDAAAGSRSGAPDIAPAEFRRASMSTRYRFLRAYRAGARAGGQRRKGTVVVMALAAMGVIVMLPLRRLPHR